MSRRATTPIMKDPVERWLHVGALAALIGGAWGALGFLGASPWAPYFGHDIDWDADISLLRVLAFGTGWLLMSVAMMLPSSLPLVILFHTVTRGAWFLIGLLVAGYLAVWSLFGMAALLADGLVHALVDAFPAFLGQEGRIAGAVLLTAGLFQFSPLKHACLEQCRSPLGFLVSHWSGGSRPRRAFVLGVRHGVFCVGCCWALMLLMLGVGVIHLGWMLALGAVMFVEKATERGRWLTRPVGVLLALWGLAVLARIPGVPAPF